MSSQVIEFPSGTPQPAEDLLGPVQKRVEAMKRDRARNEPVWHSNRAYAAGRQWLKWSRADRRLVLDKADVANGKERTTVNLLAQYLKTAEGQLAGVEQRKDLLFRREDITSEDFTEGANDALSYGWTSEWDAARILARTKRQIIVDGTAAVRVYFDPTLGRDIGQVPIANGKPLLDPEQAYAHVASMQEQGQRAQFKRLNEGRICWKTGSVFNLLVPQGIEDPEDFPYEAWIEAVAIDRLVQLYGSKAQGLQAESLSGAEMLGLREQMDDSLGSEDNSGQPAKLEGQVSLVTYFERPCKDYPKGRTVIYAGNKLLDVQEELPYELPSGDRCSGITYFRYWPLEGRFWGQGLVEPGKKIQRLYNRACQQEQTTVDRSQPYILQAEGSQIQEQTEIMQVLTFQGQQAPTPVTPPGPGVFMQAYKEGLLADLERAMGIHDESLGGSAGGATTYSEYVRRLEQDKTKLNPIIDDFQRNVDRLTELSIYDMRRYWSPKKLMALAGEEQVAEVVAFNAQKLPTFFLLEQAESARPRTEAAELQIVQDLYQDSLATTAPLPIQWKLDSIKAGRALDLPEEPTDVQERKARWQNDQLAESQPVQAMDWDEPSVHVPIHNELRIECEIAGRMDLVALVSQHIDEDEAIAAARQQQMIEAAQAAQMQADPSQAQPPAPQPAPAAPPA